MELSRRRFLGAHKLGATPFRPPWSQDEAVFVDRCTRCDDCVKACPAGLLVRGDGGFPVADFSAAACTFCGDCARACATGAIVSPTEREPWRFIVSIGDACLAIRRVECRVCGEACDSDAIGFRPRPGGIAMPALDSSACTGCGACIAPCPAGAISRIAPESLPVTASAMEIP